MKHIIFAIVALATIFATYGENLNRTYWGCEMGKTEQSACADSIKSLFKKEHIEPRTEGNFVIAEKVWLYGYEFDAAKLEFENSKLKSILLTKNFFGLDDADRFLREIAPKFIGSEARPNNAGLLTRQDGSTLIRMAQSEGETGDANIEIVIVDLKK